MDLRGVRLQDAVQLLFGRRIRREVNGPVRDNETREVMKMELI